MTSQPAAGGARSASHTLLVFGSSVLGTLLGLLANVLAMRALGPAGFGVVALAATYLTVLWQLTGRGFDQALVRLLAERPSTDPGHAPHAAALRLKLVLGAALAALGVLLAAPLAAFFVGPGASAWPFVVASIGSLFATVWGCLGAVAQSRHEFGRFCALQLGSAALRALLTAGLVLAAILTPALAVAAMAGSYLGAMLVSRDARSASFWTTAGDAAQRSTLVRYARWLVISSTIHLLYSRLDQLMLARMAGIEAAGTYAAAAQFIQIVDLLTGALLTVMLPRICAARDAQALSREARACLRTSLLLIVPALPAFVVAGPLIRALLGPAYAAAVPLFLVILPGALVNAATHPLQAVLHNRGRTHWITVLDVLTLLLSAAAFYVGIASYGLPGAGAAALLVRLLVSAAISILVLIELRRSHDVAKGL